MNAEPMEAKTFKGPAWTETATWLMHPDTPDVTFHRKSLELKDAYPEHGIIEAFDSAWNIWVVRIADWEASPHL